jgi:uncharacterized protein YndB with AHSA1/START domain
MPEQKPLEHRGRRMRLEMRTSATPEQVYQAWADPERISQWFTDRAHGEARPGGTLTWIFDEFGYEVPYHVAAAVPGERFALDGQLPGRPPFLLEVIITREGGETVLTLVNSGFLEGGSWDDEFEGVHSGWTLALAILKHYLEHHLGRPKSVVLMMADARFQYEQLLPRFTSADGLASWLTLTGGVGAVGERCLLDLRDGGRLSGRVLAVSRREVALSWDETGGVFEMKGFSMGPSRKVGLRITLWGPERERAAALRERFTPALARLASALG